MSAAITPGDDAHLAILMAPHGLNLVSGQDRSHLLAYGRDVWQSARALKHAAAAKEPRLILVGYWHTHAKLRAAEFSKTPLQEADRRDGWVEQSLYAKAGEA